ncbi:hypothetical protein LCGC14_0252170 [marine sediment metagenome]|uniref:Uncharacterized protein n=1 Tax=marine sediment metagenome TaxID=412755 RepID=A0A0F9U4I3_9ZZZZ
MTTGKLNERLHELDLELDDGAIAHLASHNDVGEPFETHDVERLPLLEGHTVLNLSWLTAMALSRQEKDWPFHVREQHYVGDADV